jgi:hypothetical protein
MLVPSTTMSPAVGSIRRLIIFIVVVLPHPEGPTRTTVSPSLMSIERFSTAAPPDDPNCLETPRSEIIVEATDSPSKRSRHVGAVTVAPAHFL